MMTGAFVRAAALMPHGLQHELKRLRYGIQIARGCFRTTEREYDLLDGWLSEGDWAIDVGANVGHYTLRTARLVGQSGRVIAFEPVPSTFALLAANVERSGVRNVTLLNTAASDSTRLSGLSIPRSDTGERNYYQAHLTPSGGQLNVLCVAIDMLVIPGPVRLVKIDAEGHELPVLMGMTALLARDHPVLIVERNSTDVPAFLQPYGYAATCEGASPNYVFRCP
jgi:FkbM family methyltransferase